MTGKPRRFGRDRSASTDRDDAAATTADGTPETVDDRSDVSTDPVGASDPDTSDPDTSVPDTSVPAGDRADESTRSAATDSAAGTDGGTAAAASSEAVDPSGAAPTRARPTRRATPAASAASRARRIGGVRPGAGTGAAASSGSDPDAADATTGSRVSTTKAGPNATRGTADRTTGAARGRASSRPASARALKDEARGSTTGGVTVVTQVPGWLRWAPAIVLGACAIAMAVVLAVSSHGVWWATPSAQKTRDQVLAAAKQCTALTNTYAWNTIPADEKRGKACTTGAQSQRYVSAMENIVKPTAPKLHASQTVQVNTAGMESISSSGSQWTVVIFGQTTIRQTGASARVDPFSTVVRMDHVHGKWLISSICLITAPSGTQAASC